MPPNTQVSALSVIEAARRAKLAAGGLARMSNGARGAAVAAAARALDTHAAEIVEANAEDLKAARVQVAAGEMSEALFHRLALGAQKLHGVVEGVDQVAALPDPLNRVTLATELDEGLLLERVTCPIGVVGVVFESRPDALPQIASLCLRSGNAVLLKGGREAERSNKVLVQVIGEAGVQAGAPEGWLTLLETREEVAELLEADAYVDLIIPRGSSALVRHIQAHTSIPVLGHADGVCHVYVDEAADVDKAIAIAVDAKAQYPAVCNAAETLLVHCDVAHRFLPRVAVALANCGVEMRGDARTRSLVRGVPIVAATPADWDTEYGDLVISIGVVDSIEEAIQHINEHGSRHTDAIVTEDRSAFERFFAEVDSAGVFLNASTRFADGFRYGFGAEVGISTGKLHPRGPVGLDGLVTYKYRLVGDGHIVADYSGTSAKAFRHRALPTEDAARL